MEKHLFLHNAAPCSLTTTIKTPRLEGDRPAALDMYCCGKARACHTADRMANTTSINLLRSSENHFWETFLKWALTTGRFLIILTETIALSAFVYRFSLDREIIDLGDKIKENQAIVSLYKDQERRYRNLHERLAFAAALSPQTEKKTFLLERFVSLARGKVVFRHLAFNDRTVAFEAETSSTAALSTFLTSLRSLSEVQSVSVDRVENKPSSGRILIAVTVTLAGAKTEGDTHADN